MLNPRHSHCIATFSIVAHDAQSGAFGVAVESAFFGAGSVVPWAEGGVGAVATQAFANPRFGPLGLAMLRAGMTAEDIVGALIAGDGGREMRQVGVIDRHGGTAVHTGAECLPWAGHLRGEQFCCQGNILVGPEVLEQMAAAYRDSRALPFPEQLVAALTAAQSAGGDSRGQQAAGLLVVKEGGGFAGYSDRVIDLRVDDHPTPIEELRRLLALHRATFGT